MFTKNRKGFLTPEAFLIIITPLLSGLGQYTTGAKLSFSSVFFILSSLLLAGIVAYRFRQEQNEFEDSILELSHVNNELVVEMDAKTQTILKLNEYIQNSITGGNSFPQFGVQLRKIETRSNGISLQTAVLSVGSGSPHPIYDLNCEVLYSEHGRLTSGIEVVKGDPVKVVDDLISRHGFTRLSFKFETLNMAQLNNFALIQMPVRDEYYFIINSQARNGMFRTDIKVFVQEFDGQRIVQDQEGKTITQDQKIRMGFVSKRVTKNGSVVLLEDIYEGHPRDEDGNLVW